MAGWSEEAISEGSTGRGLDSGLLTGRDIGVLLSRPLSQCRSVCFVFTLSMGSTSPPDPELFGAGTLFSSFLGAAALHSVFGTQSVVNKGLPTHRRTSR